MNTDTMICVDYSDKCVAVVGNTKPHKDQLKALGGKWNGNLNVEKCQGHAGGGWIFSMKQKQAVLKFLGGIVKQEPSEEELTNLHEVMRFGHLMCSKEVEQENFEPLPRLIKSIEKTNTSTEQVKPIAKDDPYSFISKEYERKRKEQSTNMSEEVRQEVSEPLPIGSRVARLGMRSSFKQTDLQRVDDEANKMLELNNFLKKNDQVFAMIEQRFAELERRIGAKNWSEELERRIERLEKRSDENDKKTEKRLDVINENFENLQGAIDGMSGKW